jgi:hypothetical protein
MSTLVAALIGDVVRSRAYEDQSSLMRRLRDALDWANGLVEPTQGLALSVGDEFQGAYAGIDDALLVTALLRLKLSGRPELRAGIGWGETTIALKSGQAGGQSGAAWWRAREAIERQSALESAHGWPRTPGTTVLTGDARLDARCNAFLLCRDHLLARMDDKDLRIALGLFRNERQSDLAGELGVTQSNVSRRQADNGPAAVYRAHRLLDGALR